MLRLDTRSVTFSRLSSANDSLGFLPSCRRCFLEASCRPRGGLCPPRGGSATRWDTFSTTCAPPCGSPTCWSSTTRCWASRASTRVSVESVNASPTVYSCHGVIILPIDASDGSFANGTGSKSRVFEVNRRARPYWFYVLVTLKNENKGNKRYRQYELSMLSCCACL